MMTRDRESDLPTSDANRETTMKRRVPAPLVATLALALGSDPAPGQAAVQTWIADDATVTFAVDAALQLGVLIERDNGTRHPHLVEALAKVGGAGRGRQRLLLDMDAGAKPDAIDAGLLAELAKGRFLVGLAVFESAAGCAPENALPQSRTRVVRHRHRWILELEQEDSPGGVEHDQARG